jgi:cobalamin biosynthesis protein CobT
MKPTGILMFVWNLLEDHRIDYLNDKEYAGDKANTESYWPIYEASVSKTLPADIAKDTLFPLFAWDVDVRADLWSSSVVFFHENVSTQGQAVYDKLKAGDYANVLRNIRLIVDKREGTMATGALAERIVREVFDANPEKMKGGRESEGGSGGDKGEGDGEARAKANGKGGEQGDAEGEGEGMRDKLKTIDCEGAMLLPYGGHVNRGEGINAHNYTCPDGPTYTPDPYDKIAQHNFCTGESKNLRLPTAGSYDDKYRGTIAALALHTSSLANNVRTQLQIISRDRWEYGKKKGRLNNASLYRVGMKDAKGFNERLFKQRIQNNTLDVCVQVLVDASGSMSGTKYTNAAAAASILNDVIGQALHIPLEILAFTELETTTMFVMKEFDKPISRERMVDAFSVVGSEYLADNVDGESLVYGFERIRPRKEKRKLMVVLSDGSPCGGYDKGSVDKHTRSVIREIESSPVELIGVGLTYDGVKSYYKKWSVIHSASEIEQSLLSLISNNIIRSV